MQEDPIDKRILTAFVLFTLCGEKEPTRSQALYFYLMDGQTGEAILLPDTLPVHVATKVREEKKKERKRNGMLPTVRRREAFCFSFTFTFAGEDHARQDSF